MEDTNKIIKILIPAVGGQGGGVLTEWLVNAFLKSGYEVQSISLPGLSQRAGSTVYYIETYKLEDRQKPYIFSQFPLPGDVDIILCQEFLELGRALEEGYGSEKTTIISSKHRIYSTLEKLPVANGIFSQDKLERITKEFSSKFIGIDALKIAKDNNMDELAVNAILFGALAASKSVPLSKEAWKNAIEDTGISVRNNILAFDIGYEYVINNSHEEPAVRDLSSDEKIEKKIYSINKKHKDVFRELAYQIKDGYPSKLFDILLEAVYRLTDYQHISYANRYLDIFDKVFTIDKAAGHSSYALSENFGKNLALMMTYEDGIRVAELKTKSLRIERISKEMQIREGQLFRVVDYLKPDAYEIYGLLPNLIVFPFLKITYMLIPKHGKKKKITLAQKPVTTSFTGFFRLWILSKMKFLRPFSHRFHNEFKIINKYIDSTIKYSKINYDLGLMAAKSGSLIKGYGDVRRRTMDTFIKYNDIDLDNASKLILEDPSNSNNVIEDLDKQLKLVQSMPEND